MTKAIKTKVLIADDEQVIADTLAMILNRSGFDALAVYSGEEAIEKAKTFQPKLLIFDVVMCGTNGIEAALEIQKRISDCKALLFSGHVATAGLLAKAEADGYNFDFILKPVHPSDLLKKLQEQEQPVNA